MIIHFFSRFAMRQYLYVVLCFCLWTCLFSNLSAQLSGQVTGVYPNQGYAGQQVNMLITGSGTNFSAATGAYIAQTWVPRYGGWGQAITSDEYRVNFSIPSSANTGVYNTYVDSWGGSISLANSFTVLPMLPSSGIVGGQVTEAQTCSGGAPDVANIIIQALPGPHYAVTGFDGRYSMQLPVGNYTLTALPKNQLSQLCPTGPANATVNNGSANTFYNFRMERAPVVDLAACVMTNPHRPGFNTTNFVQMRNLGGDPASNVVVKVDFASNLSYISGNPAPASVSGNQITWNFPSVAAASTTNLLFTVNNPVNSIPGLFLPYTSTITTSSTDVNLENDSCQSLIEITGSYDPNDKRVWTAAGLVADGRIAPADSILRYHIRFQNTGSDTAFTVVLRDTMSNHLDLTTLQVEFSSHPFYTETINGNQYRFTFPNILLVDSTTNEPESHGFLEYTVKLKPNLPIATEIDNAVGIYFDFNAPVQTNTVTSKICPPMTVDFSSSSSVDTVQFTDLSAGNVTSWLWEFGDGTSSTLPNPLHVFTTGESHVVCLTVGDTCGTLTSCKNIATSCNLSASFTGSGSALNVNFSDQSSSGGVISSFFWTFGDGNTSMLQNPAHSYATAGSYQVCLEVTDSCGTDSVCQLVTVDTVVGTDESLSSQIDIYPNPSEGRFMIAIDLDRSEDIEMRLRNQLGQEVWSQQLTAVKRKFVEVDVRDVVSGVYFLEFRSARGQYTRKLAIR